MRCLGFCHVSCNDTHDPTPSVRSDSDTVQAERNDLSEETSDLLIILYFLPVGTSLDAISSTVKSQLSEGIRIVTPPSSLKYTILLSELAIINEQK